MTNLLWPGDHRAGTLMTDQALWTAMVRVESAWLEALAESGVAPAEAAACDLTSMISDDDREQAAVAADESGNPVLTLVTLLRQRAPEHTAAWIHRGLTSQDVVDTALMVSLRDVADDLGAGIVGQIADLAGLIEGHRRTPMVARTLTQAAVPTTFGAKAAAWLTGICDAYDRLAALETPVQIGGAAGTLAASTELARLRGVPGDPAEVSVRLLAKTADALGLAERLPWHTTRAPVTTIGDALVSCTDAWGHIAADVVTLSRPEIGELNECNADGRGGSSTMPDKRNPVLSVLIRRAALTAPHLAATLHTAASMANDERPDGAWHAEWDTVRTLARRTVVAGSHCSELLAGLQVNTERMAANLAAGQVSGEQHSIAKLAEKAPSADYFGAIDIIIDAALDRGRRHVKGAQ